MILLPDLRPCLNEVIMNLLCDFNLKKSEKFLSKRLISSAELSGTSVKF